MVAMASPMHVRVALIKIDWREYHVWHLRELFKQTQHASFATIKHAISFYLRVETVEVYK
jgi:hypothetical protein